jgi:hypothetical protein
MSRLAMLAPLAACLPTTTLAAGLNTGQRLDILRACRQDLQSLCGDTDRGGGRMLQCMAANRDKLSSGCSDTLAKYRPPAAQPTDGAGATATP